MTPQLTTSDSQGDREPDPEGPLGQPPVASAPIGRLDLQGRALGDFVLGEPLDEGGFGVVVRAEQRGLGRQAVVKVIRRSLAAHREAIERFAREARLAAHFDHPYAAHVYAFGIEPDGLMWIAMELVRGTPLSELLRRSGPLPLERFVPLFERLCEVIQSAHDQGIVHRDIKPSNVMVITRAGRLIPKLLDFGVARLLTETAASPGDDPAPARPLAGATAVDLEPTAGGVESHPSPASLTHRGQVLGSPVYMAPEQWLDATTAGPPADQYALALLAYEALTGERGVVGDTLEALAHAHRHAALQPLPRQFPAALYDVLSRAADKAPERRFATVTELARALRTATGIDATEPDDAIPALPVERWIEWSSDAPRPIAEAIAALASARTVARAAERVTAIAGLLARWLGVLAIACRSRFGRTDDTAALETELLVALRRRALADAEWLDLAIALARGRGDRREAWPVPEMAAFLSDRDAVGGLRSMVQAGGPDALDDTAARAALERRIAQLAAVLDPLGWLLDYTLARETPDGLELWMGQRSDERALQRAASDGSGAMVLLDAYGARLARLSPLFEVAAPMPGEPDELFLLAGPGRASARARFISYPRGFEREDDRVWRWLAEHLLDTAPRTTAQRLDDSSPYPGLAPYTASDHESFVGREREVEELLNRLRTHAMVTVVGPSGIGKTSLLAAGVVPALAAGWRAEILRPGNDPLGVLAALTGRTAATAAGIATALAALAGPGGTRLVVIVDQAEELFTMCTEPAARDAFAEALAGAAAHPGVRVVISLRDDFLCRADQLPAWRGRIGSSVQVLRVPGRDDLERMIVLPARQRGHDLDDPALAAEIAGEVADRPGALPLLAFTAAKLWEQRDRHFRRITRATYDQIGGVTGALVQHADGVIDPMPAPDRRLVRLAFRRLLTADGLRALIGRGELETALGGTSAARTVVARLLAARLLISRDDDAGDRIEIIHETLATTWPRLAAWRREDADAARLQEQLAVAARHWDSRRRPADLLWRGAALADLVRWNASADRSLTELEDAFASASTAAAARARRRRLGTVAGAFAMLAAGVFGLAMANRKIAEQRAAAVERLAASFEERGRLALADGDAARAMLFLAEAAQLGAHGPGLDVLTSQAAAPLDAGLEILGHGKGLRTVISAGERRLSIDVDLELAAWGPTGRSTHLADLVARVAAVGDLAIAQSQRGDVLAIDRDDRVRWRAEGAVGKYSGSAGVAGSAAQGFVVAFADKAAIFELGTGRLRTELAGAGRVNALAIAPSGTRFATGDLAGAVTIWDPATGTRVAACEPHTGAVHAIAFAPDERTLVSGGNDGEVRICDPSSGATVHRLIAHSRHVVTIAVSPDGQAIVSGGGDGKPRLWDARTGRLIATLEGHHGVVGAAAFSPDGSRILTVGTEDGSARFWNREGMALGSVQGHGGRLNAGYWERDGHRVITAGTDGAIRRWDADLAITTHSLQAHSDQIVDLAVSHDDRWALTGGADGVAVLWDLRTHQPTARLRHDSGLASVELSRDGASALTTDEAGRARLWSIPDGALRRTFDVPDVTAATYAGDGSVVIAAGRRITFRTATGAELAAIPIDYDAEQLSTDPQHRWMFVTGYTSSLLVVDLAARRAATRLPIHDWHAVAAAADDSRVAVGDDQVIRLWRPGTWESLGELVGHQNQVSWLWFLPDGRLASTSEDATLVWGRDNQLRGRLSDAERVYGVATPPDAALIATIGSAGVIKIWDGATYQKLLALPSHRLPALLVQVTHDGSSVLSAGRDGRLVTWQLGRATRSPSALAHIVRCRVPLRLDGDIALPRDLDFADPTCAAAP